MTAIVNSSLKKYILVSNVTLVALFAYLTSINAYANAHTSSEKKQESKFIENIRFLKNLAGDATSKVQTGNAFSHNSFNLSARDKGNFLVGNDFFEDPWVVAPSSTTVRDGLGPLFNMSACQACHINDGSGHAPINKDDNIDTMLIRVSQYIDDYDTLSSAEKNSKEPNVADVIYGRQLQNRSIIGLPQEVDISIDYEFETIALSGDENITLRRPIINYVNWGYGKPNENLIYSPRVANQMIGLGLLEAIDEKDIIEMAERQKNNDTPISGVANQVWDIEKQETVLGRFGWKAGQPSVKQQVAAAFNGDLGLTSKLFMQENCTEAQAKCLKMPNGNDEHIDKSTGIKTSYEIRNDILDFVTFYSQHLAVPSRRNTGNEEVINGAKHFEEIGCAGCHQPSWQTNNELGIHEALRNQTIWPFTDMLLHDMGEDLSDVTLDNMPVINKQNEFLATSSEFRTAPLWGIGLRQKVNKDATFLHDGRARTIQEAILWHGGEAEFARESFKALSKSERLETLKFLESL